MSKSYLAIDLGTTNTVVCEGSKDVSGDFITRIVPVKQFNKYKLIDEQQSIPSVMFIDYDNVRYIGQIGKDMRDVQSLRVISNSKRYMGLDYKWEINGETIRPKDVAASILKMCKASADNCLFSDLKDVVITVPASFNTDQINDTIEAAKMAGFENIDILPEPTAALIDYINQEAAKDVRYMHIDFSTKKRILVFDLGGGTCDISVIDVCKNGIKLDFHEIAVGRYDELGGVDFDFWAAEYLLNKFIEENDIDADEISKEELTTMISKLAVFCEYAKEKMASEVEARRIMGQNVNIKDIKFSKAIVDFYKNKAYEFTITMHEYNKATESLYYKPKNKSKILSEQKKYKNIEEPIWDTLNGYGISPSTIDYVYLTGGMCKYPRVYERIREILGKPIIVSSRPMEAVARGAAVYHYYSVETKKASSYKKDIQTSKENNLVMGMDITKVLAEAIMVDVCEGLPHTIIEANHPVPYKGRLVGELKTTSPSGIKIDIFAGKNPFSSKLRTQKSYVAKFDNPIKTGTPIDIEYEINENKYLTMAILVNDGNTVNRFNLNIESDVELEERKR